MQRVNPEGLYATIQAALPHLRSSPSSSPSGGGGRILVVSPPIYSRFFRGKTAYAVGKVGMSVLTKGLAMDFDREGSSMAITSLWPAVVRLTPPPLITPLTTTNTTRPSNQAQPNPSPSPPPPKQPTSASPPSSPTPC